MLSNPHSRYAFREDRFLAEFLKDNGFRVDSADRLHSVTEDHPNLVLIRNIWPTTPHKARLQFLFEELFRDDVKTYNPLQGKADMSRTLDAGGKHYLIDLFRQGFPVVPSVGSLEEIGLLGRQKAYFIKPVDGESGHGCRKVSFERIMTMETDGYIIQPFIEVEQEISFYFIDSTLQYSLYTPDTKRRWDMMAFTPKRDEIRAAQRFIDCNNLSYGIQRVDACRVAGGQLLFLEVEDYCPYLNLLETEKELRNRFSKNFLASLNRALRD